MSKNKSHTEHIDSIVRCLSLCRPLQESREISFIVTDNEIDPISSSEAMATVFVQSVDNPPLLDLNGPGLAGRNHSTSYTEGSSAILVSVFIHEKTTSIAVCSRCSLVIPPSLMWTALP